MTGAGEEPMTDEQIMGIDVPWTANDEAALESAFTPTADWRYFAEALAWYDGPNLTGAQTFGVIEALRQALRDGRVKPDDLGMVRAEPFGADGRGLHCEVRHGRPCDCTTRTATYWRVPR